MIPSAADKIPELAQLIRRDELERVLQSLLEFGFEGVAVFDSDGRRFAHACEGDTAIVAWVQLPAEAVAVGRARSFGLAQRRFEVRDARVGVDRIGTLVYCVRDHELERAEALTDAGSVVITQVLQSAYATWVTSELHLAASESSHRALQQQNVDLKRAVEHLRELDKLKSNFLGTVSHELRTPLTSVIGFSEMLLDGLAGELNAEQREYVQTIFARGEELLSLITQILEMSRLEVGALRLDLAPQPLRGLVERAKESVHLVATKAKIAIENLIDDDQLPAVVVDADKLHQVLVNLFSNAIRFSREGGHVTVTAECAPLRRPFDGEDFFGAEAIDGVRVSVRDTGKGMPGDQLERIFEPFYQVDSSPTREHGGAGLGLSIVRNLIDAHGGDVWAESTLGSGTAIHFTLPIARVRPGE